MTTSDNPRSGARGPAGDFDYERAGRGYRHQRRTDPSIAAYVTSAFGDAASLINVGAGAGSYEPADRYVVAVEPSPAMRRQRPSHLVPAVDATAEHLPFDDHSFDAALAAVTVHQWPDAERGLRELRRVTRGPVVILTFDGDLLDQFWLADYVPELMAAERRRYPAIEHIRQVLGGTSNARRIPVPKNCVDGFTEAYFARPEKFLDPAVRQAQSAWGFVAPEVVERAVATLRADLESGAWDRDHRALRTQDFYLGSLTLIAARPSP